MAILLDFCYVDHPSLLHSPRTNLSKAPALPLRSCNSVVNKCTSHVSYSRLSKEQARTLTYATFFLNSPHSRSTAYIVSHSQQPASLPNIEQPETISNMDRSSLYPNFGGRQFPRHWDRSWSMSNFDQPQNSNRRLPPLPAGGQGVPGHGYPPRGLPQQFGGVGLARDSGRFGGISETSSQPYNSAVSRRMNQWNSHHNDRRFDGSSHHSFSLPRNFNPWSRRYNEPGPGYYG